MVNVEEFKRKIQKLIAQEYKVEFLGDTFDQIVNQLTEAKAEKIGAWLRQVIEKNIQPILVASKKPYKDWRAGQLLTFRYPFTIGNSEYRILLVKVKNSIYIEFHLGDHKYYDTIRKELDLTNK